MKLTVIGASGFVGSEVLKEALNRGHQVTAIVRHPEKVSVQNDHLSVVRGDVMDTAALAELIKGSDMVISAYNAGWTNPNLYNDFLKGSQSIQEATRQSGVKRLLVVGGAGSLFIAPGVQVVDTPEFPADWKPGASAARDYLSLLQKEDQLDWTFLSPALEMHQGTPRQRTGVYRTGLDNPVFDANNKSAISVNDLAVAIIDEAESPKHIRKRFTVAY
ncbi:NAD(P)-dependent oxidoreductase [Agriterribacter sp.]|uniref:NAD(P)-dependent oxidoreductase n=1 Tax=Agriterribacter sp. TaxID=2821509 RepID=UPI002BE5670B|nr:NAD(P)-dependent oxidoreductase [Agriterribacter sp.]HRO48171.1 NAD(P)-dependent oxidoreductase [Agriterribacter sp.]HRQ19099.1 NAD(P)-dependent oxidoreductase [Agriterribacter sp.]